MNPSPVPDWIASELANLDDLVIVLDEHGRILSYNEEAERLIELEEAAARNRPIEEIFPLRDEFSGKPPVPLTRSVVLPVRSRELRAFDMVVVPRPDEPGWTVVLRPAIAAGDVESEAWAHLGQASKEGTGLSDPRTGSLGIVSETFAAIHGYKPVEMLGLPYANLLPIDEDGPDNPFKETQSPLVWESRHVRKDGTVFPARIGVTPIRDPLGNERFRAMRVEDITERKAAEERIEAHRRTIERVLDVVPSLLYIIDVDSGRVRFLSRAVSPLLPGLEERENEASISTLEEFAIHPGDLLRFREYRQNLLTLAEGEVRSHEYRMRDPEGWRWYYTRNSVFERDEEGRVSAILGAATDISEVKAVSETLRETEALRDLAASSARIASWWWDFSTGEVRIWNDAGRIYGFPASSAPGEETRTTVATLVERFHPLDRDRIEAAVRRTMEEGVPYEEEVRSIGTGETIWLLMKGQRVPNEEGKPTALAGVSVDITERKRLEEASRESEARMLLLIESAKDHAIFSLDLDRRIDSWNSGATAIFGYREEEILGQSGDILFTPEDREGGQPEREARTALTEGRAEDERWHLRKDGTRFYASGVVTPLLRGEVPSGFVKIARDLTARVAEEARGGSSGDDAYLLSLNDALLSLVHPVEIYARTQRMLKERLGASCVSSGEVTEDGAHILSAHDDEGVPNSPDGSRIEEYGPVLAAALREGRTVVIPNTAESPFLSSSERETYAQASVMALVGVPLVKEGRYSALLSVHQAEPRVWTEGEVALSEETARRTWAAVERAKREADLREANARMSETLANLGDAV